MMEKLFKLGKIVCTQGFANSGISQFEAMDALQKHQSGDWGILDRHDKEFNNCAVRKGHQILSAYRSKMHVKFYVITESDRSVTTLLLPDEY